jgi:hypothetical protein
MRGVTPLKTTSAPSVHSLDCNGLSSNSDAVLRVHVMARRVCDRPNWTREWLHKPRIGAAADGSATACVDALLFAALMSARSAGATEAHAVSGGSARALQPGSASLRMMGGGDGLRADGI